MNKFVILFLLLVVTILIFNNLYNIETFDIPTNHERPFVNIYDDNDKQLKIVLLSHPFTRDSSYEQYKQYKKDNFLILGITSYNEFPSITTNKHDSLNNPKEKAWTDYDYMKVVDGWLHCFRDPNKHIKDKKIPKALISESDFTNTEVYCPDSNVKKIYDFVYVCPKDNENCDGWVSTNKNWNLAQKCIKIMCKKYNMNGILIGRKDCKLPEGCEKKLTTTGFLSQLNLIEKFRQSKFILIPNETDASPRILTESLCCDLPVLLNYNIVGGWKYINKQTGAFFHDEKDLEPGLNYIRTNYANLSPRKHYLENYGKVHAGKKLKSFIKIHFKDKINVDNYKYIRI